MQTTLPSKVHPMANILVIDDESEVRYAIRAVLEDQGHAVDEADTGTAGLAAMEERAFDLVICDIIMPDKEGIETIVEIKQRLPQQKIVAISGGGRIKKEDYLAVAAAVGATYTVSKPFDAETLTDMVNAILRN
jgi:CheY-like chemotaxis protein